MTVTPLPDRTTRLFFGSDRLVLAGMRALRGTFDGIWLGLLRPEQLARIDQVYYDRAPEYTTETYNRSGLSGWEQAAIQQHFAAAERIIVTSAGGGREVLALAERGHRVVGFEPHPELVRFGNRLLADSGVDATIRLCGRDGWPPDAQDADGVVVGWGGYMLLAGRARRVRFLQAAAERLPAGAPLLLSFFTDDHRDLRLRTTARVGSGLRRLLGREPISLGDALVPNLVHFFTRDEIADELAAAGIELIDFGTQDYGWAVGRVRPRNERERP